MHRAIEKRFGEELALERVLRKRGGEQTELLVQAFLELGSGLEGNCFVSRNGDFLVVLWVATFALGSLLNREGSKTGEDESIVAAFE